MAETPLVDALRAYAARTPARFHMPGHKGFPPACAPQALSGAYLLDVTELSATGSLYDRDTPDGPFARAEDLAARAFGADATLLCAGGATLCIQTLVFSLCGKGLPLLVDRHSHKAVFHAAAAYGLEVSCVAPEFDSQKGLYKGLTAQDVRGALEREAACAVFVTSPDYYGAMADIAGIADVCRERGVALIVDNAHGTHLAFLKGGALHPLRHGCDACVDSAHKTLPALTGGAFLHILGERFDKARLKGVMSMLGSSSPSHLITASLDAARAFAEVSAGEFDRLCERCGELRAALIKAGIPCLDDRMRDPLRIVVDTGAAGLDARRAAALLEERGVFCEMADSRYLVLLPSPHNKDKEFQLFLSAICSIIKTEERLGRIPPACEPVAGEKVLSIREAVRRPSRLVSALEAAGHIAAEVVCAYPPASAVALPGEHITPEAALWLSRQTPGVRVAVVDGIP